MIAPPQPKDPARGLSPATLARFLSFITAELGIKMNDAKLPMLHSRLQRRLRVLGLSTLDEYHERLFNSAHAESEREHFVNAVTTNKTDFFREPQHFDYLVRTALPAIDPGAPSRSAPHAPLRPWKLNLWCAGCSSGEEPYTLAMVLAEFAAQRGSFDFSLLATDVSTRVLDHARTAIYREELIAPIPTALRTKYLLRRKDATRSEVRIVPDLRRKIAFHELNFMHAHYGVKDRFEVIFFRNVMIYFDKPTQEAVIQKLCRNLVPGGFLFVGHSESLAGLDIPVAAVGPAVYRKPA